jgi:murein DD-endopeptidase MepM/ murein hydrolase activator NlpD
MRFQFPWPIKPSVITQGWGVKNPAYLQFGFGLHNGVDYALGTDKLIRAPFAGTIVRAATQVNGEWQPNGGGVFISLLSAEPYLFDDNKTCFVLADFLHCETLMQLDEVKVKTGDVLAKADNTGFSTGPHTHIQLRRVNVILDVTASYIVNGQHVHFEWVDTNDANDSFDPTPYYTNTYVADLPVDLPPPGPIDPATLPKDPVARKTLILTWIRNLMLKLLGK